MHLGRIFFYICNRQEGNDHHVELRFIIPWLWRPTADAKKNASRYYLKGFKSKGQAEFTKKIIEDLLNEHGFTYDMAKQAAIAKSTEYVESSSIDTKNIDEHKSTVIDGIDNKVTTCNDRNGTKKEVPAVKTTIDKATTEYVESVVDDDKNNCAMDSNNNVSSGSNTHNKEAETNDSNIGEEETTLHSDSLTVTAPTLTQGRLQQDRHHCCQSQQCYPLGSSVNKQFGKQYFSGEIDDFDAENNFYLVRYEDGDEEEYSDNEELESIVVSSVPKAVMRDHSYSEEE